MIPRFLLPALGVLIGATGLAFSQGAGNIVTTLTSNDLIALDSGTLASSTTPDAIATYVNANSGNALIGTGVNKVSIAGGATTVGPVITVGGTSSDTNIGIILAGKGTGAAHLGGTTLANASLRVPTVASAVNQVQISGAVTTAEPVITAGGSGADSAIGVVMAGKSTGSACLGGTTCANSSFSAPTVASAVNHPIATGAVTSGITSITAGGTGADANAPIAIAGNGTGPVYIGGTTTTLAGLQVAQTASRVNSIVVTPSATTVVPSIAIGGAGADANRNLNIAGAGTGIVTLGQAIATCSGTTTATCQGQRFVASVTGLSTAAGAESAAMTVTNASVVSSSSIVLCSVNIYAGTGVPMAARITPGTGSVSFVITNVAGSGSLNATVPVACVVF